MPVKEARTPAENRHGGAPRDAASRVKGRQAPRKRLTRVPLHPSASRRFAPVVREQKG
jgi:hypothetical protein